MKAFWRTPLVLTVGLFLAVTHVVTYSAGNHAGRAEILSATKYRGSEHLYESLIHLSEKLISGMVWGDIRREVLIGLIGDRPILANAALSDVCVALGGGPAIVMNVSIETDATCGGFAFEVKADAASTMHIFGRKAPTE